MSLSGITLITDSIAVFKSIGNSESPHVNLVLTSNYLDIFPLKLILYFDFCIYYLINLINQSSTVKVKILNHLPFAMI